MLAVVLAGLLAGGLAVVAGRRRRPAAPGPAPDAGVRALAAAQSTEEVPAATVDAVRGVPGVAGAAWLQATPAHLRVRAAGGELACLADGVATAPAAPLPEVGDHEDLDAAAARSLVRQIAPTLPDRPLQLIGLGDGAALAVTAERSIHPGHLAAVGFLAITVRDRASLGASLRRAERRARALTDGGADLTVIVGSNGRILDADGPISEIAVDRLVGRRLLDVVHPSDHALATRLARLGDGGSLSRGELRVGRDRTWRVLDVVASDLRDDPDVHGVVLAGRDVTARAASQRDLAQQALHDPLTGLPNRSAFQQRLRRALDRDGAPVGVLFVDLDAFKPINDTYGHATGDAALRVVAARLRAAVRDEDVVARLAGDEFAALTVGITDLAGLRALADRLADEVSGPASVPDGVTLELRASVGGALARGGTMDAEALIDAADQAMYVSKRGGGEPVVTSAVPASAVTAAAR